MHSDQQNLCPHCQTALTKWETPPYSVAEGSGWETEFLLVCANNDCAFYRESRGRMREHYDRDLAYRYMLNPDTGEAGSIIAI
jgi:hypothetical protein